MAHRGGVVLPITVKTSDGRFVTSEEPTTGDKILSELGMDSSSVMACHVNYYPRSLDWVIDEDAFIEFIDMNSHEGMTVYRNSLSFLLTIAARKVLERSICLRHSIDNCYYWELENEEPMSWEDVEKLKDGVKDLVRRDLRIYRKYLPIDRARRQFESQGQRELSDLIGLSTSDPIDTYFCDNTAGYYYGALASSTRKLKNFNLIPFSSGLLMQFPSNGGLDQLPDVSASEKLSGIFLDYARWLKVLGVSYMNSLHRAINSGNGKQLILISEAFHGRNIAHIAEAVANRSAKVVTIAGPSSSGKTTFSERLKIQLLVLGKRPVTLPMDNYFKDHRETPLDEKGQPNFEIPEALNLALLAEHVERMLAGEEVLTPRFDFIKGEPVPGKTIQLEPDDVLIMEGIHGLHGKILSLLPKDKHFGIFTAPMTGVCLDPHNRTSSTDHRLLRRIVRDARTRGFSAERTLTVWPKVVEGAEKYIFPYQGHADAIFNSSCPYELAVLKDYVAPLLHSIPETSPVFGEVRRLQNMLKYVPSLSAENVPNNSVLREFIGGTCFEEVES
jgi:uridine kinase